MINFRFHIASLIAIFLALALGVIIGAGVVDRGVVDALNTRLDTVEANRDRIEGENGELTSENEELRDALAGLQPQTVHDLLIGDDVAVIAVRGVSEDTVDATVTALQQAGSRVPGILWLESGWNLDDDDQVQSFGEAIGITSKRPDVLRRTAWTEMATQFEAVSTATEVSSDVLAPLDDAGFIAYEAVENGTTLAEFPGRNAAMTLVVGTEGDVPADDLVMPASKALVEVELPLVVGDVYVAGTDVAPRGTSFAELRQSELATTVSTVDDLDRPQGPTVLVLAQAGLEVIPPVVGHFGRGQDVRQIPELVAS